MTHQKMNNLATSSPPRYTLVYTLYTCTPVLYLLYTSENAQSRHLRAHSLHLGVHTVHLYTCTVHSVHTVHIRKCTSSTPPRPLATPWCTHCTPVHLYCTYCTHAHARHLLAPSLHPGVLNTLWPDHIRHHPPPHQRLQD